MVKPSSRRVNPPKPKAYNPLLVEQATIWGALGLLALAIYFTGLDNIIAWAVYNPNSSWAWGLRQYGTTLSSVLAIGSFVVLLCRKLWEPRPLLYQISSVILITTVIGAGLLSQVVVQDLADRARPRETVLVNNSAETTEFAGNSMPSGHAAMAVILAAPFFLLRRRRVGQVVLGVGVFAGVLVGLSRMVLGAHFASDVLVALAITLSTASLAAWAVKKYPPIPVRVWVVGALIGCAAILIGNRFTVDLSMKLDRPFRRIELPCNINAIYDAEVTSPTLRVTLTGYGAPLSTLQLEMDHGVVELQRHHGLYRDLSCTAELLQPITLD